MQPKLSPTASGTLAALRHEGRLKSYFPESAKEFISDRFAQKDNDSLTITEAANKAAQNVYSKSKIQCIDL